MLWISCIYIHKQIENVYCVRAEKERLWARLKIKRKLFKNNLPASSLVTKCHYINIYLVVRISVSVFRLETEVAESKILI